MKKEQVIRHRVERKKEGSYYSIPFTVPEGVDKLTVRYAYHKVSQGVTGRRKTANIIDLGLQDGNGRFLGWSGSAKEEIHVGRYGSEKGYFSEPIQPGEWHILVGAYKVADSSIEVTYIITFEKLESRFYFGDLHVHTEASDGKYSAWDLAKRAKKQGLDFIAFADHNNFSENDHLPRINDFTCIPAVEWTHYKGHMNLFGVRHPFENGFIANHLSEMKALLENAREKGAYVSVNHPKCGVCPYLWGDDTAFDWMEIWNGPMRPANARALTWWTQLLRLGRKIPIVGGSDYHKGRFPVRLGQPVTAVYSPSPDSQDLLKALAAGHAYVTSGRTGTRLSLTCGDYMMGDTIPCGNHIELTAEASFSPLEKLILVSGRGERELSCRDGKIQVAISAQEGFAYLKTVPRAGKSGFFTAVTNPLYFHSTEANTG